MKTNIESIEVFFLETLLKVSFVCITIVMAVDFAFNRFDVARSLIVNGAVLFAIVSSFLLHRRGHFRFTVLWIGFLIMIAMFYQSIAAETITTSSMAVVMLIGFAFSVLLKGTLPVILHIITATGMSVIFFWLSMHPERYAQKNASDIVVAGVTYLTLYILIALSSKLLKDRYDGMLQLLAEKNRELAEKAAEIEAQNEELQQSQENLFSLNNHLEQLVEERTNKIKEQNDRLVRYAYANAHHIRGPVARLLGLVQLSKLDTSLGFDFLFSKVEQQTRELDEVVKGINRELEG
jgi:hypothetical protein